MQNIKMQSSFTTLEKELFMDCTQTKCNKTEENNEYCTQETQDIEIIRKSHKKCGEIYMTGTEDFKFVCILCEKTFFTCIEEFLSHVAHCQQKDEICAVEIDPLEAEQDYDAKRSYVNKQSVILKKELTESFDFNTDDVMPTDSIEKDVSNFVLPNHENIDKMVAKNKVNINSIQLFSCNYCEKNYTWRDSLRRHLRRNHPNRNGEKEISTFTKMNKTGENDTNYKKDDFQCESIDSITEENLIEFICCDISDFNKKFKKKESLDTQKRLEHKEDPEKLMVEENDYSKDETDQCYDVINNDVMPTDSIKKDVSNFVLPNHENIDKMVAKNKVNINSIQLFSCNYCEKNYTWRDSLRRHLRRNHPNRNGEKEISTFTKMNKTGENDTNYKKDDFQCESIDRITEENSKEFICCDISDCNKKFKKKEFLNTHKRLEHKEDPEKLTVEENDYSKDETDQDKSEETRDELNRYSCKYCGQCFKARHMVVVHERIHTGEKPFKCSTCGKGFRIVHTRNTHELTHQGIKPYKCDICNASFLVKTNLTHHIQRHFGNKKYQCTFCEKKFHSSTEKVCHETTHTGEKPCLCFECGKRFNSNSSLNTHMKSHSGVKPFKCDQCDKRFYYKKRLKDHYVVHTGEKPFTCSVCDAKFPRRKSMKSHMKIHSDVAQYSCTICGKSFKQGPGLYSHMKSHGKVLTKP